MRAILGPLALLVGFALQAPAPLAAQSCTGLACEQQSCPAGGTTSISGTVYAPNGIDPLPDVLVYIPNAAVEAFAPGVSCPVVGTPPSGSPLVGATTAVDGTFTITNVPVGASIPLVIQTGRWRRQILIPTTTACANTALTADSTRMPRNRSEGDIPKIAVATGAVDTVECVLLKVGLDKAEFTNANGTGRINLYSGAGSAGAEIDTATPDETALMGNAATLESYDVLMLPCQGGQFQKPAAELANLIDFTNKGGRVYSSHFSYVWMYQNPPFDTVAKWHVGQAQLPDGIATVDRTFSEGVTLAQWLQLVGASTTPGQIGVSTLRHDMDGVNPPTQSFLTLNDAAAKNPVMQFVFDTPVGATANQCGRVLFNEYHVEAPTTSPRNVAFPNECNVSAPMTPQEKLLEFSLFELTADGAAAKLSPTAGDFGSEPINFSTPSQTFTWTNNSTFGASVTLLTATGDFAVTGNNCSSVAAGASCSIGVDFTPVALGARTGTLTVGSSGSTLVAQLTGIGTPDLNLSGAPLNFGNLDVGASRSQTLTVSNPTPAAIPMPALSTTGDFSVASACGSSVAAGTSCLLTVTFHPTTTGTRPGSLAANSSNPGYSPLTAMFSGNGVDFSAVDSVTSGSVIAGYSSSFQVVLTPIAGFNAPVTLACSTTAPGTACIPSSNGFTLSAAVTAGVTIATTSQYTVVGYGGFGGRGWMWLVGLMSGVLLLRSRRAVHRFGLALVVLGFAGLGLSGCSGKLPAQNAIYTAPGTYSFTITATDGFLVRTSTYSLTVTAR